MAACSRVILEEYGNYVNREREALQRLPRGKKEWWARSRRLLQKRGTLSSIPALKDSDGKWEHEAAVKADLSVRSLSKKHRLAADVPNEYTEIEPPAYRAQKRLTTLTVQDAEVVLSSLREDSGTGPDNLSTRILKQCAAELATPVWMLTLRILATGTWPDLWLVHWLVPLYKKKAISTQTNYRGIHLTSQLSKAVERLLKSRMMPFITRNECFGRLQEDGS